MASAAANGAAAERVIPAISEPPIEESVDESSIMGSEEPYSFDGGLRPKQQDFFSVIDEVSCESKPVSENNVSVV